MRGIRNAVFGRAGASLEETKLGGASPQVVTVASTASAASGWLAELDTPGYSGSGSGGLMTPRHIISGLWTRMPTMNLAMFQDVMLLSRTFFWVAPSAAL